VDYLYYCGQVFKVKVQAIHFLLLAFVSTYKDIAKTVVTNSYLKIKSLTYYG